MSKVVGSILAVVALMVIAPSVGQAQERDIKDALADVRDALSEAREGSTSCKSKVIEPLKEARDDLKDALDRPRKRRLTRLVEDLADIQDDAGDYCDRRVKRNVKSARRSVEDAVEALKGGGGAAKPAPAVVVEIDCWDKSDPGCYFTRNGKHPMGKAAWNAFLTGLKGNQPFNAKMKRYVEGAIGNNYMTSKQLGIVIKMFKPHNFSMKDVALMCAPKVVDPQNGLGLGAILSPHKFSMEDVNKAMAKQPHGQRVKNAVLK